MYVKQKLHGRRGYPKPKDVLRGEMVRHLLITSSCIRWGGVKWRNGKIQTRSSYRRYEKAKQKDDDGQGDTVMDLPRPNALRKAATPKDPAAAQNSPCVNAKVDVSGDGRPTSGEKATRVCPQSHLCVAIWHISETARSNNQPPQRSRVVTLRISSPADSAECPLTQHICNLIQKPRFLECADTQLKPPIWHATYKIGKDLTRF